MAIVDLNMKAWLGFENYVGGNYIFRVKLCRNIEVAGIPLISLGAGYMTDPAMVAATIKEILLECPAVILAGSQIPYWNGTGIWECPEDIKFDRCDTPSLVNGNDFTALSVIPWTIPTFWQATLYYIPIGSTYTTIPASIPNYEDPETVGVDGAVFVPVKSSYYAEEYPAVAYDSDILVHARLYYLLSFAFEGVDLGPLHILSLAPTEENWYADSPYRQRDYGAAISQALSSNRGFTFHYESSATIYELLCDRWETPYPVKYFPTRTPVPEGGGVLPVNILGIMLFLQGLISFGIKIEEGR